MILLGLGALWSMGATLVTVLSYVFGVIGILTNFSDVLDILRGIFSGIFG